MSFVEIHLRTPSSVRTQAGSGAKPPPKLDN